MTDPRMPEDWDARYAERRVWSGHVNPTLAQAAAALAPGRALDLASGEGGDALWLAERGWSVTAVDFAAVALGRLSSEAAARGLQGRVSTVRADLAQYVPDGTYDLVSTHYLHEGEEVRRHTFAAAARATTVGGTLLIVGHSRAEEREGGPAADWRWDGAWAVEAAGLDEAWEVEIDERERVHDSGHHHGDAPPDRRVDTVVRAVRRR